MNPSLEQQLRQMTPPKTMKQARELAAFGDAAVEYLRPQQTLLAGTTAACVRALALISSERALAALEEYAADGRTPVVEELERAWTSFDREDYARRVLAITYRDRTHLKLISPPGLDGVQHFHQLRSLRVAGWIRDFGPLAGLTQLEELDLSESLYIYDLGPLRSLTNLRSLKVTLGSSSDKPRSYDLEPLSYLTRLTTLHLSGRLDRCDFSFLANVRQLTELDIHGRGEAILSHLSNRIGLRKLRIASSTPVRSLEPLSQLTDLTDLALVGGGGWRVSIEEFETSVLDLSPLTRLIHLISLVLAHQYTPTDLSFLRGLEYLESLFLANCTQLKDFSSLADVPRLASLAVRDYRGEHLRLCELSALTSLSLANIQADTLLLADLPVLNKLHLERGGPASSVTIHSLIVERVPALPELTISSWWLRQLACADLPVLSSLTINDAANLHTLTLRQVPRLMRVNLSQANRLQRIQVTGEAAMKILSLSTTFPSGHLDGLPQFEGLSSLEKLWIWAHQSMSDLVPLQQLPRLRELALHGLQDIEDFTPLTTLTRLEDLLLSGCSTRATRLGHLPQLATLSLAAFVPQEPFTLENLPRLRTLSINHTRQHELTFRLMGMPALQRLSIQACALSTHPETPGLSWDALPALTELDIDDFGGFVHDLESLRTLQALEHLNVFRCRDLANLEPLTDLPALKRLTFRACPHLHDLTPLGILPHLESLQLLSCKDVDDLGPLSSLPHLTTLWLSELENLRNFSPIAHMSGLQELSFSRCPIEDLSMLQHLPALRKLTLFECKAVRDLTPLLALPQLEELEVLRMRQVEVLPALKKRIKVRRY